MNRIIILAACIFLVSCSQLPSVPAPTNFCDHIDKKELAANYSLTFVKKPHQFDGNYSYWNLCGPAWTRGGASLAYSPSGFDLMFPETQLDLNPKRK